MASNRTHRPASNRPTAEKNGDASGAQSKDRPAEKRGRQSPSGGPSGQAARGPQSAGNSAGSGARGRQSPSGGPSGQAARGPQSAGNSAGSGARGRQPAGVQAGQTGREAQGRRSPANEAAGRQEASRQSSAHATPTSTGSFADLGLPGAALAAVGDLGYEQPSPVQAQAIPLVLQGRDVMAAAQTGTGKTAAFLLPTLARLGHARRSEGPLMLVVTPTRELAQQIEACAKTIGARTGHSCTVLVGGVGYEPQREALRSGCDLLVATPGRLIDLMNEGTCRLSQVEVLVLDEADRMLDMGFLPSMRKIVSATPDTRQTLLFSATLGPDVFEHTKALVRNPARVEIAPKGTAAETIDQFVLGVEARAKVRALAGVLGREGSGRVIVFCRGKHRADGICRQLRKAGFECAPIHGNRTQGQRENALRRFASGEVGVLVATDVLARGIDIAEVAYVVNLDVPSDAEDYIHRIGRTGRAGTQGWALTFVTEDEYLDLRDIEQLMGKVIPPYPHAGGLDVGEAPFAPDPRRNPREQLPGKAARKKMKEQREAARAAAEAQRGQADGEACARDGHAGDGRTRIATRGGSSAPVSSGHTENNTPPARRSAEKAADGAADGARPEKRPSPMHEGTGSGGRTHPNGRTHGNVNPPSKRGGRARRQPSDGERKAEPAARSSGKPNGGATATPRQRARRRPGDHGGAR